MSLLERFKDFTTGTSKRTLVSSILLVLLIPVTLWASAQRWELRKEAFVPSTEELGSFVAVEFSQGLVGVSKEGEEARVTAAIQEKFGALERYEVPEELKGLGLQDVVYDFVIVYTQDGEPLRPDLDALTDVSQIGHEDNNLTFTFSSPDNPWTPEEDAAIRQHFENAYLMMKEIAGPPAFDITVNVQKEAECVEGLGGYYSITRNIIGICPDTLGLPPQLAIERYKGVATHEMGHAFHDDAICVFEEGFAESMSTEVDIRLGTLGELNKYHILNMWYENQNKDPLVPWAGSLISPIPLLTGVRYLSAGFVFSKIYIERDNFFRSFHQDYYQRFYDDPSIAADRERLKNIIGLYAPTVESVAFNEWYSKQYVLHSGIEFFPEDICRLYPFFAGVGNVNAVVALAYCFGDIPYPGESPLPDTEINFTCETLFSKERVCEGSMTTDEGGLAYYLFPLDFLPQEPFKISFDVDWFTHPHRYETYGLVPSGLGLFGIAPESNGTLTATYGDQEVTTNVSNGKFSLLELLLFRGRVDLRFEGERAFEKSVTKDSSPYFVHLACIPESTIPGDLDCNCRVDIVDIMKVAAIWNTEAGDPKYNPDYNFDDKDNRISIADVMYIAAKWNTRCGE